MAINYVAEVELGDGSNFNIKDEEARGLLSDHESRLLSAENKVNAMYESVNYVNQNAFSYFRVKKGTDLYDTISADVTKDVVTFIPGDNINLTADLENDALTLSAVDTTYDVVSKTAAGLAPQLPNETATTKYLRQDGSWNVPPDTKYNIVSKTAAGLAPQLPNETTTTKYLRQDGTWTIPPDTKYSVVSKTAAGLTPQLPNETSTTKYLRQDGSWSVPPNTTYGVATSSANGLMSSSDKSKLDGIDTGANAYVHPAYTARTGQPTANATPAFGGTFTVSQITSDATGHVTGATNRTITIPSAVSSTSAAGLCPKLGGGTTNFLRADGTWAAPAQSAVPVVSKTANGLAPQLPNETSTTKYLRQDGSWAVPPDTNTTYSVASTTANGLMTYGDKIKLNGIEEGAERNLGIVIQNQVVNEDALELQFDAPLLVVDSGEAIPGASTRKETISLPAATTSQNGYMSASDKTKLNGISTGAEKNRTISTFTFKLSSNVSIASGNYVALEFSGGPLVSYVYKMVSEIRLLDTASGNPHVSIGQFYFSGSSGFIVYVHNWGSDTVTLSASNSYVNICAIK